MRCSTKASIQFSLKRSHLYKQGSWTKFYHRGYCPTLYLDFHGRNLLGDLLWFGNYSHGIHIGSGFINDQDTGVSQHCSGQTDQLALTNTEVLTSLTDLHEEAFAVLFNGFLKLHLKHTQYTPRFHLIEKKRKGFAKTTNYGFRMKLNNTALDINKINGDEHATSFDSC